MQHHEDDGAAQKKNLKFTVKNYSPNFLNKSTTKKIEHIPVDGMPSTCVTKT